jgi:hypothetical protein
LSEKVKNNVNTMVQSSVLHDAVIQMTLLVLLKFAYYVAVEIFDVRCFLSSYLHTIEIPTRKIENNMSR